VEIVGKRVSRVTLGDVVSVYLDIRDV